MPITSRTDWTRVKHEAEIDAPIAWDEESELYNPNDDEAVDAFFHSATIKSSKPISQIPKEQVAINLSQDVLTAFRATGQGWQNQIDDALRDWLKTHSLQV